MFTKWLFVYKIRYERRQKNWHAQENTVHLSGRRMETTVIQKTQLIYRYIASGVWTLAYVIG